MVAVRICGSADYLIIRGFLPQHTRSNIPTRANTHARARTHTHTRIHAETIDMSCIAVAARVPAAAATTTTTATLSSRRHRRATPSSSPATWTTPTHRVITTAASRGDDERAALAAAASTTPAVSGRRLSLVGFGATALAAALSRQEAAAELLTPRGYDDPTVSPSGWNVLHSDADSIGCSYTIEWPSGWCALSDLSSARSVGVDASFKNPVDEASTLAVFVSDANGQRSVSDQGSLEKVAASRADSAPRQLTVGKRKRRTAVGGGARGEETTALTYDVETKVGGGTAGRFGSAVELVGITVYGGKEYLVRATASAAAWPGERARLRRAVESFRITSSGHSDSSDRFSLKGCLTGCQNLTGSV